MGLKYLAYALVALFSAVKKALLGWEQVTETHIPGCTKHDWIVPAWKDKYLIIKNNLALSLAVYSSTKKLK